MFWNHIIVLTVCFTVQASAQNLPFILSTWLFTPNATLKAWDLMYNQQVDIMDSIVGGCSLCEIEKLCGGSVGYGDKPSESGEVTLDAMIMDGRIMDVGAVGCLRGVKNAIGVAQAVMRYTKHTILMGELASDFAIEMGFPQEDLSSNRSWSDYQDWQNSNCQPNFWENVTPDPSTSCGPYTPIESMVSVTHHTAIHRHALRTEPDHDTIGMVAIDGAGNAASGVTTNGLSHKIPGRVGDSPVPGAGSYAENGVGAAAATGNGDIMLRFLPSYHAVQLMSEGQTPLNAAKDAVSRIGAYYPEFNGAVIAVNVTGGYGAACFGYADFPYNYINPSTGGLIEDTVICEP